MDQNKNFHFIKVLYKKFNNYTNFNKIIIKKLIKNIKINFFKLYNNIIIIYKF